MCKEFIGPALDSDNELACGSVDDSSTAQYDSTYGDLTKVTLPTGGGTTTYAFNDTTRVITRTVSVGNGVNPITSEFFYDGLGRVLTARRSIGSITKDFGYTYYDTSTIKSITYPSGRTITYQATAGGDIAWAKDVANNVNYATAATYSPGGTLTSLTLGQTATFGGIFLNQSFNPRGQPISINAWSTNGVAFDVTYCFNLNIDLQTGNCAVAPIINNGNVSQIKNNLNTARTQNFTYDELNRIKKAWTQTTTGQFCWGIEHGYDIWANLLSITQLTTHQCSSGTLSMQVSTANRVNNPSGHSYDAVGNLTQIPSPGNLSMTYDAENRITTTAGVIYTYDGEGLRLKKSSGKLYWYGIGNDTFLETDPSGSNPVEFVFFDGKRIARRDSSGTISYFFSDHLGTSRIVTSAAGTVLDDSDFYPFGGERVVSASSGNAYKFTSKERDVESGLDFFGARFYSSTLGRFTSSDPIVIKGNRLADPQRFNLYAYTRNNPLVFVDPDGRDAIAIVFPDYKIDLPLFGKRPLGHAGIVTIDSKGRTRYFEYGRYPGRGGNKDESGRVRERPVMDVKIGADGQPTAESLKALMNEISQKYGQGGRTETAYYNTDDKQTAAMNRYATDLMAKNESPDKDSYNLWTNNCATFVKDVLDAAGVKTPTIVDPRPKSIIRELKSTAQKTLDLTPNKGRLDPKKDKKREEERQKEREQK